MQREWAAEDTPVEMGKKKKKAKAAQDNGQAGGAGGATAMQVEAVVVGGHCAELYPSLILRVGPESQLLFQAGAGLQRYWCALAVRQRVFSGWPHWLASLLN